MLKLRFDLYTMFFFSSCNQNESPRACIKHEMASSVRANACGKRQVSAKVSPLTIIENLCRLRYFG